MGFHMLQLVCVPIYTIRWRRRFLSWGERQEEANCKFSTNGGLIFYSSIQPAIHLFELSCLFLFYFFSHLSSYQEPVWQHVALQVKHVFQIYKKKKHKRIKIFFYAKYRLRIYQVYYVQSLSYIANKCGFILKNVKMNIIKKIID